MCIGKTFDGAVGGEEGQAGGEDLISSVCFYLTLSFSDQAFLLY